MENLIEQYIFVPDLTPAQCEDFASVVPCLSNMNDHVVIPRDCVDCLPKDLASLISQ